MLIGILRSILKWIEKKAVKASDDVLGVTNEPLTVHEDPLVGRFAPAYPPSKPLTLTGDALPHLERQTLSIREAYRRREELLALRRTPR